MGYDSDDPMVAGEVGKVGVAIDSLDDMKTLFGGLPLDQVSTSMTINAPAAVLLLMYQLVAEGQGVDATKLAGTIQNDVLKEYIARGTYIFPPKASLRLVSDIFAYCRDEMPRWNTISISGYHMAEAGATPVQEIAFTLANAKEYVRAAQAVGLGVDDIGPRLSFFFVARTTLLEEIAKFRAARRVWARIVKEEFGSTNPKSQMLRFHTQTAGVQLTAQQPEVNLVRVALQGLGAVLGGTQSLHTNSFDEAIALPSEKAARLALRTQQVIAYESDVTKTVDPLAGSYVVESLTDDLEEAIAGPDLAGRAARRCCGRDRAGLPEERDRALGLHRGAGDRRRRPEDRRGQRRSPSRPRSTTTRCGSTRPSRWRSVRRWSGCGPSATGPRSMRRWQRCRRRRPVTETCWCRCGRPWPRAPPWARSATRCARCGGPTPRPTCSEGGRPLRSAARIVPRARPGNLSGHWASLAFP